MLRLKQLRMLWRTPCSPLQTLPNRWVISFGLSCFLLTPMSNSLALTAEQLLKRFDYSGFPLVNSLDEMLVEGYVSRGELEAKLRKCSTFSVACAYGGGGVGVRQRRRQGVGRGREGVAFFCLSLSLACFPAVRGCERFLLQVANGSAHRAHDLVWFEDGCSELVRLWATTDRCFHSSPLCRVCAPPSARRAAVNALLFCRQRSSPY